MSWQIRLKRRDMLFFLSRCCFSWALHENMSILRPCRVQVSTFLVLFFFLLTVNRSTPLYMQITTNKQTKHSDSIRVSPQSTRSPPLSRLPVKIHHQPHFVYAPVCEVLVFKLSHIFLLNHSLCSSHHQIKSLCFIYFLPRIFPWMFIVFGWYLHHPSFIDWVRGTQRTFLLYSFDFPIVVWGNICSQFQL